MLNTKDIATYQHMSNNYLKSSIRSSIIILLRNSNHPAKLWETINEILGHKKHQRSELQVLKVDGNTYSSSDQIAEVINLHFTEIGKNLAKAVPKTSWDTDPEEVSSIIQSDTFI